MRVSYLGDSHGEILGPAIRSALPPGYEPHVFISHRGKGEAWVKNNVDIARTYAGTDVMIVQLGGNNRTLDYVSYQDLLTWVVNQVRATGARYVIWIGPFAADAARDPDTAMRHEASADIQRDVLPRLGVYWIDGRPLFDPSETTDGVHWRAAVYRAYAQELASALPSILAGPPAEIGIRRASPWPWVVGATAIGVALVIYGSRP